MSIFLSRRKFLIELQSIARNKTLDQNSWTTLQESYLKKSKILNVLMSRHLTGDAYVHRLFRT